MIYAQKGNKQRQIAEADIQTYVEQGYRIVDGQGTVIQETVPDDLATLKTAYKKHMAEIRTLKARVQELSEQVNAFSKAKKETKVEKETEEVEKEETAEPVEKKTRVRKAQ